MGLLGGILAGGIAGGSKAVSEIADDRIKSSREQEKEAALFERQKSLLAIAQKYGTGERIAGEKSQVARDEARMGFDTTQGILTRGHASELSRQGIAAREVESSAGIESAEGINAARITSAEKIAKMELPGKQATANAKEIKKYTDAYDFAAKQQKEIIKGYFDFSDLKARAETEPEAKADYEKVQALAEEGNGYAEKVRQLQGGGAVTPGGEKDDKPGGLQSLLAFSDELDRLGRSKEPKGKEPGILDDGPGAVPTEQTFNKPFEESLLGRGEAAVKQTPEFIRQSEEANKRAYEELLKKKRSGTSIPGVGTFKR